MHRHVTPLTKSSAANSGAIQRAGNLLHDCGHYIDVGLQRSTGLSQWTDLDAIEADVVLGLTRHIAFLEQSVTLPTFKPIDDLSVSEGQLSMYDTLTAMTEQARYRMFAQEVMPEQRRVELGDVVTHDRALALGHTQLPGS